MARYIDADLIPYVESENGVLDDFAYRYDINEIPSADVIEVVRCKDCRHSKKISKTKPPFKYYKDNCVMCTCEDTIGDEPMVYLDTHYCGYGETRINELECNIE